MNDIVIVMCRHAEISTAHEGQWPACYWALQRSIWKQDYSFKCLSHTKSQSVYMCNIFCTLW